MYGITSALKKSSVKNTLALTSISMRSFSGGAKIIKIPADQTDFDICVVGGYNATSLVKFW